MSKQTSDDLFDLQAADPGSTPAKPVRKAAAKKAPAKKAAAKKAVAKKAVAKKTVAKKAVVAKSPQAELPIDQEPAPLRNAPAKAVGRIPAEPVEHARPSESPETSHLPRENPVSKESQEAPRIGRVPGGGPVNQSSHPENRSPDHNDSQQPQRESRSKKRRDKRKKRRREQAPNPAQNPEQRHSNNRPDRSDRNDRNDRRDNNRDSRQQPLPQQQPQEDRTPTVLSGPAVATNGIIEMTPKGFGFLRLLESNFEQAKDDIFISPELIRTHSLRHGQWLHGTYQESSRGPQLAEIRTVNDMTPDAAAKLPHFDELKAINPNKRISFETTPDRYTTRVVDIVTPVGRGQRGLIVSPPRSGKTTLLLHMAEAIREKYDEQIHLMVLLVDERPEEVTEFRRALPGAEIYASSNDEQSRNHCRIAELAIERAKRLVEAGKDVFILMDSITRLARAYNGAMSMGGKGARNRATGSGGITIGALEAPRRLFAAARNTREAGSLTILATALIQTNSRADEAIYMEFKGTGNMELVLDRKIAESYVYPAVDIFKSGTRREELLLPEHTLHKIHLIRRGLSGHRPYEAMERLLYFIKKFPNNPQMLLEIKG